MAAVPQADMVSPLWHQGPRAGMVGGDGAAEAAPKARGQLERLLGRVDIPTEP